MTASSQDPQPGDIPGLEPGGGVPPGETPPDADSQSFSAGYKPDVPESSSKIGITVVLIGAALFAVALLAWVVIRFLDL